MTLHSAKAQIMKGINDHEEGRITYSTLLTLVEDTMDELYNVGYTNGIHDAEIDDSTSEVEFDVDIDFDGYEDEDLL